MALPRMPFLRRIACLVPITVIGVWMVLNWPVIASGGRGLLTPTGTGCWPRWRSPGWAGWRCPSLARARCSNRSLRDGCSPPSSPQVPPITSCRPDWARARSICVSSRGCGIPLAQSSAALALYLLAEAAARVVLLLTLLTACPGALRLDGLVPNTVALPLVWAVGGLVCAAALAVVAVRPLRRVIGAFLGTALTDARALHARPARALALWGGSLAFPVLQAAGLVAVALAVDVPVPVTHVALAYLAASIAAAAVPTPGGIGSVDAALVVALVAAGASVTAAGSVVLGYRIITVWLPLIPGALVLGALVRSKVV